MEPTPIRDLGPYMSESQARAQFDAVTFAIPGTPASIVLAEALVATGLGLDVTEYEQEQLAEMARQLSPEACQVINGWIMRAHLSGKRS